MTRMHRDLRLGRRPPIPEPVMTVSKVLSGNGSFEVSSRTRAPDFQSYVSTPTAGPQEQALKECSLARLPSVDDSDEVTDDNKRAHKCDQAEDLASRFYRNATSVMGLPVRIGHRILAAAEWPALLRAAWTRFVRRSRASPMRSARRRPFPSHRSPALLPSA